MSSPVSSLSFIPQIQPQLCLLISVLPGFKLNINGNIIYYFCFWIFPKHIICQICLWYWWKKNPPAKLHTFSLACSYSEWGKFLHSPGLWQPEHQLLCLEARNAMQQISGMYGLACTSSSLHSWLGDSWEHMSCWSWGNPSGLNSTYHGDWLTNVFIGCFSCLVSFLSASWNRC